MFSERESSLVQTVCIQGSRLSSSGDAAGVRRESKGSGMVAARGGVNDGPEEREEIVEAADGEGEGPRVGGTTLRGCVTTVEAAVISDLATGVTGSTMVGAEAVPPTSFWGLMGERCWSRC